MITTKELGRRRYAPLDVYRPTVEWSIDKLQAPNTQELYRTGLQVYVDYWLNPLGRNDHAHDIARRAVMAEVYGDIEQALRDAELALYEGDVDKAIAVIQKTRGVIRT